MQWIVKQKIDAVIEGVTLHPVIEQLLLQRGMKTAKDVAAFFTPDYDRDLHDPFLFRDMDEVVGRVTTAIATKERVGIFGDHDADGVSSAVILAEALEGLGLTVDVYIPDKLTEGHGINTVAIDGFTDSGVTVMFSVDCGSSDVDEVAYAKQKGIDVIITDHHHVPEIFPDAYAIINPHRPGETYPFTALSGTAVAFKVIHALYQKIAPEKIPTLKWMLDVVCVGTVGDCVPLLGENRTLVAYGLIVLSKTRRAGYKSLCAVANIDTTYPGRLSAETIAYYIAPRINAAGRMRHARDAFDLLRAVDDTDAYERAAAIEDLNEQRKKVTDEITRHVENAIKSTVADTPFIIVADETYPVGIIGIVAGRIAEKYRKPTGIFTRFDNDSRGSFRSVEGVNIIELLHTCSEHIASFGGHEKAAGATVSHTAFDDFVKSAHTAAVEAMTHLPEPHIAVDMEITLRDIDIALARSITTLAPFGEGNTEPLFLIRDAIVVQLRAVGNTGVHVKVTLSDDVGTARVDAIGFFMSDAFASITVGDYIDVVAYIQENVWNGNISVQLRLYDVRVAL